MLKLQGINRKNRKEPAQKGTPWVVGRLGASWFYVERGYTPQPEMPAPRIYQMALDRMIKREQEDKSKNGRK